jgi:hypothetical protein
MEAKGQDKKHIAKAARIFAKIPGTKLDDLTNQAHNYCATPGKCIDFDDYEFLLVAVVLWKYFIEGVDYGCASLPNDQATLEALLQQAYDATSKNGKSGELIASRIHEWGNKWEHVTNYCAFRCGIHAAEEAGVGGVVKAAEYKAAFKTTYDEMALMMSKCPHARGGGC